MGRRHSIAGKKAAGDAKKSANYGKIGKIIQIAAKKGADPKMNPALDLALSKARQFGLPKEVIQKAILKGSGQLVGEDLQEVFYEGYGPGGSAFVVKTLTPNTNRTSSNIKGIIGKHGGTMGLQGSVSRQFKETGVIVTDGKISKENINGKITDKIIAIKNDEFENEIINLNIQDFEIENGQAVIYTDKQHFAGVKNELDNLKYNLIKADLEFIADNQIKLNDEDQKKLENLIQALEDDEDVDMVWNNAS